MVVMCGEQLSGADKSKHASFLHVYKQIAIVKHVNFLFFTCLCVINWKVFNFKKIHFKVKARGSKIQIDVQCTPCK